MNDFIWPLIPCAAMKIETDAEIKMRILLIFAHPSQTSFSAALRDSVLRAAHEAGHDIQQIDLYAQEFDPRLSAQDHNAYDLGRASDALSRDMQAVKWANALVFVFPTWWSGAPAMLKGWIDRTFVPGFAFHLKGGTLKPGLTHLRNLSVVTTLGSPWWHWTLFMGAPGRKQMLRGLRSCTGMWTKMTWLALHNIRASDEKTRTEFMARVCRHIANLR
jgi:putative NADPH-quinone reductase